MDKSNVSVLNSMNEYASLVLSGKILACVHTQNACKRHFADLERQGAEDFPYIFDESKAAHAIDFIELLPHTKGEWGRTSELIRLELWQKFIVGSIFGWVKKGLLNDIGLESARRVRRFDEAYIEVARKNGKSELASGIALYMLAGDDEFGAEVYCGAVSEDQAWEVFRPARLKALNTPEFVDYYGVTINARSLSIPSTASRFEPIIGKPGDGSSPHLAIADEFHEHPDTDQVDTMRTGMLARKQPLMLFITTAGFDISSPCYSKRMLCADMLAGIIKNDNQFAIIYTLDVDDDWTDKSVLIKANPNLGVSIYEENFYRKHAAAVQDVNEQIAFQTKNCCIWLSARRGYFNMEHWNSCEVKGLEISDMKGQPCILSFDLASKLDLTVSMPIWWEEIDGKNHYTIISPKFWIPRTTVWGSAAASPLVKRYQSWALSGLLEVIDGDEIDYREIFNYAVELNNHSQILASPIDPHGATALSHSLDDEGYTPITITQNYTNMSDGMKELQAAAKAGRIKHDGNPILAWCIANVSAKYYAGSDDVVRPIKDRADSKIDGAVTLIQGLSVIVRRVVEREKMPLIGV